MRRTAAEFIGSRYQSSFDEHRRRQVPETWNPLDAVNDEVTIRTFRGLDGLREIRNSWATIRKDLVTGSISFTSRSGTRAIWKR